MKRRAILLQVFLATLAGFAAPLCAQKAAPRRVGVVTGGTIGAARVPLEAFFAEMSRLGWIEGRSVIFDWAAADGQPQLLEPRVAELIARKPDVIVAAVLPTALAVKRATTTIPLVFASVADPVGAGLVKSLARPGGNATGISPGWEPLSPKRIQLLREIMPRLRRVGYLREYGPTEDAEAEALERAASAMGLTIVPVRFVEGSDIDTVVAELISARVEAIHASSASAAIYYARERLIALANRARLPVVVSLTPIAELGALFSYGGAFDARFRRAAQMTSKILEGAKPADMPVEQSTEFEFVLNEKAARVLGITIPAAVRLRADRVIE